MNRHSGTGGADDASDPGVTPTHEPQTDSFPAIDPFDPYGLLDQALTERKALVELCLYALDRARSTGVAERLEQGLAAAGVRSVRPDGQRFDPAVHEAGGVVATTDASLDGVVAETEVVGFTDHGRLLRPPVVIVYQVTQ